MLADRLNITWPVEDFGVLSTKDNTNVWGRTACLEIYKSFVEKWQEFGYRDGARSLKNDVSY